MGGWVHLKIYFKTVCFPRQLKLKITQIRIMTVLMMQGLQFKIYLAAQDISAFMTPKNSHTNKTH